MAIIVVRCPKSRVAILPGINVGEADFGSTPCVSIGVKCPVCGEEHFWLPYATRAAEALALLAKAPALPPSPEKTSLPQSKPALDNVDR
jgi:hypothetical protein